MSQANDIPTESSMISTTRVTLAALLLGSATLVAGQTSTQRFAD